MNFSVINASDVKIGYWGIYDITPADSARYVNGAMTIDYADKTGSFALASRLSYPFTIKLDNDATRGITIASGNTYEIEVGISNKYGISPNPFTFWLNISVIP